MLDFINIATLCDKTGMHIKPKFKAFDSKDLMIRGGDFYAIWDEQHNLWSTSEGRAIEIIDGELAAYKKEHYGDDATGVHVSYLWDSDTGMIDKWHKYCRLQMWDNYVPLDENLVFANTDVTKETHASKKLPYSLEPGTTESFDELINTLYSPEEAHKIEWSIGAVVSGKSKEIQKFLVFYGSAGTGKSTILNIIEDLFEGYTAVFDAKALGQANNSFALESLKSNPLVAIQHDGDLSHIEDNTRLNSIVSHELMTVNEKFKSTYSNKFNCFLFMGTNRPVKITDAKSGIIRRLINVSPNGSKIPKGRYNELMRGIKFELGGIAWKCKSIYEENPRAYDDYIPTEMLGASNDFYNFVLDSYDIFKEEDGVALKDAWAMYQEYCREANVAYPYSRRQFQEELKNYFRTFTERIRDDNGSRIRNFYSGFLTNKFDYIPSAKLISNTSDSQSRWLMMKAQRSIFDSLYADAKAQYAGPNDVPLAKWDNVNTTLSDLDTGQVHYVKVPRHHIVIDFDLKDENGNKSLDRNMEAANSWPKTYAELSKSGSGIHLHYIYSGDVTRLSRIYDENIEIKVFTGNSSLRRRLTKCNDLPISTINSNLPLKGETKVVSNDAIKSEKELRAKIAKALRKEIWPNTKPSIDFIYKIVEDTYASGMLFDISDMKNSIASFALGSSHQSDYCIKLISKMHFKSDNPVQANDGNINKLMFFDVEVFPNLFVIVAKEPGKDCIKMINPTPLQVSELTKYNLVGFNNRRYDNHILYARMLGASNEDLFERSQKIIEGSKTAFFGSAYNLSYADIYDFSSKKQSLKKFEIELGIHHSELGLKWDEPVEESLWEKVADYCVNDVVATEATFYARKEDFVARQILADISGLTVNDTTRMHTTKIIFGDEKHPDLEYTDLSEMFPGYSFENGHSNYRDEDPGEGGYVYAEPGIYTNVALLDIASMHPSSIIALNLFGSYTKNFKQILDARLAIKHHDFDTAKTMLNGALEKHLSTPEAADALAKALKIVINSVYGYTTATFDNPFKDIRNVDNIVAKRGALFMINLKHEVQSRGFTVAHIKTDSIKIPNATPEIIQFVMDYGKNYGYNFEHEATYDRMCLVNEAVYIAHESYGKESGQWTATGTQFQIPFVFKTLFSKEPIIFSDLCETKTVTSALYLDMNEELEAGEHDYRFVGKVGQFCPMKPGTGGGDLMRSQNDKFYFATGSKGYKWMESERVRELKKEADIDRSYYLALVDAAKDTISQYGDFEWFVSI